MAAPEEGMHPDYSFAFGAIRWQSFRVLPWVVPGCHSLSPGASGTARKEGEEVFSPGARHPADRESCGNVILLL